MYKMRNQNHVCVKKHILLVSMTFFLTVCTSDGQGKKVVAHGVIQDIGVAKTLSSVKLGDKIKDLLVKRPERNESSDFNKDFENLFWQLDSLVSAMPADFEFDIRIYGPPDGHPTLRNTKAMKCLNDSDQLKHFMQHVHEILRDLKKEYFDDIKDSKEKYDTLNSRENDDKNNQDDDDFDNNSMNDSRDRDTTTDSPDSQQDSMDTDTTTESLDSQQYSRDRDTTTESHDSHQESRENITLTSDVITAQMDNRKHNDYIARIKRDTELEYFDLDELLDRLEDEDVECLAGFISNGDKQFLCHHFAHRSSDIFIKIISAGAQCDDYLLNDNHDDDKHYHLDESHQLVILKLFKEKDSKEISVDDVRKLLRLAPDVIDDDFLEELPEEIFKQSLRRLGRLAAGTSTNPSLRYALRKRLNDLDLSQLSSDDIREIGPGLLSLSLDQIQTLNGTLLLDLDVDDLYDNDKSQEQNSKENWDSDDDDDDDEDDIKLAIEHRIKETIRQYGLQKHQIGRSMHYLHHDLSFVYSVDPDDLFDALEDIRDIHYDFYEARLVLNHLTQSSRFPPIWMLSGHNLTNMGKLLRGMDTELLSLLNKTSLDDALDDISNLDFDNYQAYQLLENMGYTRDSKNYENFDAPQVRRLGKLFRGISTESITLIKQDTIVETLEYLDDLDLSDALKNTLVEKARQNEKISPKFLSLKNFAEVISLDDLDEFNDDDIRLNLNISSHIRWRLSQAALLAHKYKMTKGTGRMRPSRLVQMKILALGLLPEDLDDMIVTQDDVLDISEELKDIQNDLTSGQIDELVEHFIELSGLDKKQVVIGESEAMQGAHILAYLPPKLFGKLKFTKAGKMAFVSQVAKMPSHKMSRNHIQFLTRIMLDMLDDVDNIESRNNKSEDHESQRLRSLGQMALGLTSSQIKDFSGKAIIDNLDILRTLALTKEQAKAVLEKIEDTLKNWRCNSNILARVGPLLQFHDNPFSDNCDAFFQEDKLCTFLTVIKDIEKRREAIQKRLDEGFAKETDNVTDDTGEKILVDAIMFSVTKRINVRNQRATNAVGEPLTCDILIRLGKSARLVDLQSIKSMSNEELKRCLPHLGTIGSWSQEMLQVLAEKVKMVYEGVSTWPAKTVAAAGSIIAGLSPAEIQMLSGLNGIDVMNSIGRHGKLSAAQLKAGFKRWMELNKKKDVSDITSGELSSLSEFVCGLEPAEISKLKNTTFKRSLHTIGQSTSCTPEQRQAYMNKALVVYGAQVSRWTPSVVADMGYTLGALNDDQIKMLNSKQLALVSPKIIQNLPKDGMAAMSLAQLMSLSTNQANAVTHAQYQALTAEQQNVVGSKATIDMTKQDNIPGGNNNGALMATSYGLIILTTILLVSMMV